jgi:serine/threonine protein kinase/Tol biopolymer transport system component
MPLSPGENLGPYEILSPIGKGGMGEVYRAHDSRLKRDVAIKVSTAQFSERFEREAQAIAALNHPNICQLYDVGPNYLVMEYIEGTPLKGPLPVDQALKYAIQICDALDAAHAKKITHRDLKPANILITKNGVKLLDFGLAKIAHAVGPVDDVTVTMAITGRNEIVGTLYYMSPEQLDVRVDGPEIDARSDIFSFGLVLYEILTGKRAIEGSSPATVIAAILQRPAPSITHVAPVALDRVLGTCLAKNPEERWQSVRDLKRALEWVLSPSSGEVSSAPVAATRPRRFPLPSAWVAAGLAVLAAAFFAGLMQEAEDRLSSYRFTPISRDEGTERFPEWSPDGNSLAYTLNINGVDQVFTKMTGAPDASQLTHGDQNCSSPFWSPDGSTIYYTSNDNLWAVSASGGNAAALVENASGASIHPDGKTIAFTRGGKAWIAPLTGGSPREFWDPPHHQISWKRFSPDGRQIAVLESGDLWILSFPRGEPRKIRQLGSFQGGSWLADNRHLVVSELAARAGFALSLLDLHNGSRRVIYSSPSAILNPSASPDGKRIAFATGQIEWNVVEISLANAAVHTLLAGGGISFWPDWARSGSHFLVATDRSGASSIEDVTVTERFSKRLAVLPQNAVMLNSPRWSPDASRFGFNAFSSNGASLLLSNAAGAGQVVLDPDVAGHGFSWSPDGQWIAFLKTDRQLVKIRPGSGAMPIPFPNAAPVASGYSEVQWSPSGHWILYPVADGLGLISADGNAVRHLTSRTFLVYGFSNDGAQVFGISRDAKDQTSPWQLYSTDVRSGMEKRIAPVYLPLSTENMAGFSLHADGKRFLTSIAKWPYDIWVLEGFDQPKGWLDRLLRP